MEMGKMSDYLIKMHFSAPLRIGESGIGLEKTVEFPHSDTLFSALCHAVLELEGESVLHDFLVTFPDRPALIVSSCFPWIDDVYFLPKPMVYNRQVGEKATAVQKKTLKSLNYLKVDHFALWCKDEPLSVANPEAVSEGQKFLAELDEYKDYLQRLSIDYLTPRVALDRASSASNLFSIGQRVFAENAGLYFLLRLADDQNWERWQQIVTYLGELGIGGERSSGFGRFTAEWIKPQGEWGKLLTNQGKRYFLAGLFHPEQDAIDLTDAQYQLLERRGWFWSRRTGVQMKRKTVWMFAEGSIFPVLPKGHLVDVKPDAWTGGESHPIFRNGLPFVLQI